MDRILKTMDEDPSYFHGDYAHKRKQLKELLKVLSDENLIDEDDFDKYLDTVFKDYSVPPS